MSFRYTLNLPQSGDSVLEFGQLHQLRRQTQSTGTVTSAKAEEEVARQFEALLIQQMLKQARQATQDATPGLFDSAQTRLAQSLGDEQLAQQLAKAGIGLAQALLTQIRGPDAAADGRLPGERAVVGQAGGSRLDNLQSSIETPRRYDAASITGLLTKLGKAAASADTVFTTVRGAPQHIQSFVSRMSDAVQVAAQNSGIPAKLILSQAALESGWGQREILHADGTTTHNLFGIKATSSWQGKVATITTTEYIDGQPQKVEQAFRAYDSYEDAFSDYARLVGGASRYQKVAQAASAEDAARRIQDAGYATDPAYADKLISIMGYLREGAAALPTALSGSALLAYQNGAASLP